MSGGEGTPTETYRRVIPVDASIGDVGDVSSKSYNKFIDEKVDASIDMESERHGGGSSERHSDRILWRCYIKQIILPRNWIPLIS